jgi:hypothetical protein
MGTIRENGKAAALVLRLKVDGGRIAEAETLVLRNENTAANLEKAGAPDPLLLETVPTAERLPRGTLVGLANTYFEAIEQGNGGRGAVRRRLQPLRERHPHRRAGVLDAARHAHLRLHPVDPAAALHGGGRERQVVFGNFMFNHPATSPGSTCRARGGAR